MRVSLKEIRYIVVLAIGGILFWVFLGTYYPSQPVPSGWVKVIPTIGGFQSTNVTTNTFNITAKEWEIRSYFSLVYNGHFVIEVYNASNNEKLENFMFSTNSHDSVIHTLKSTGSFYLRIQIEVFEGAEIYNAWWIAIYEYIPVGFQSWILPIIVGAGIALLVMFFGYEIYKVVR